MFLELPLGSNKKRKREETKMKKAIIIGALIIAAVCGAVLVWDKWKHDCVDAGVCKFDGQESSTDDEK